MALILNLESTQFGVPAPQAYAKIINFHGNKDQIQVQVAIYFNEEARQGNMATVREEAHYIAMEDIKGDFVPAIYDILKTLPQYENSVDC